MTLRVIEGHKRSLLCLFLEYSNPNLRSYGQLFVLVSTKYQFSASFGMNKFHPCSNKSLFVLLFSIFSLFSLPREKKRMFNNIVIKKVVILTYLYLYILKFHANNCIFLASVFFFK